jgi:hypothetical protein
LPGRGQSLCTVECGGLLPGMNALTDLPPPAVRILVHRKLDEASDAEVAEVHRMLQQLEVRRLREELGAEFAEDWEKGRLTTENVAEAVQAHRAKQTQA